MDALFTKLRSLDAHPKVNEDFYSRTLPGGIITVVSSIIMFLLFVSEIRLYLHPSTETKLVVDTSRGERLRINFDVTFPALQCSVVSLDAMDISGEEHLDVRHDIIKKRIDVHGNVIEVRQDGIGAPKIEKPLQRHGGRLEHNETYCGSCYGAEMSVDDCCNSCEEVREAYSKKGWGLSDPDMIDQCKREGFLQRIKDEEGEGCTIYGFLDVNRVAGNFHFAPGKSFQQSNMHVHDLLSFQKESYNISHKINRLTFGDFFPGVFNPLDGVQWIQHTPYGMYKYFIKVVPTVYTHMSGHTIQSNQFSVTEHFKADDIGQHQSIPGVFFFYDLSPIKVSMEDEASKSVDSVKENQDKEPSLTDVIVHRIKVSNQENTAKSVDAVKEIEIEDTTINPKKISRKAKGKSKKRPRKDIETDDAKQTTPRKKDEHVGHPAVEEIAETQTPSKELDVDLEEEELADTDSDFDPNAEKMNVDLDQEVLPDTDSDFDLKAEKMRKKAKGKAIIEQPVAKSRSLKETEEGTNSGSFSIKKPIKQAIFRTAYSIRQFYDAVSKLSSEQIQAVEEMGFSKILQIKLRTLPRSFIKRICDTVDPEGRHMNLGVNGILPITPADVQFVLGVPAGPELFRVKDRHMPSGKRMSWKEMVEKLNPSLGIGREFRILFLRMACAVVLCPGTDDVGELGVYNLIATDIIDNPQNLNWAEFVLDWLMNGIKRWKERQHIKNISLEGSLIFLILFYVMKIKISSVGNIPHSLEVSFWTDEKVTNRLRAESNVYQDIGWGSRVHFSGTRSLERPIISFPQYNESHRTSRTDVEDYCADLARLSDQELVAYIQERTNLIERCTKEIKAANIFLLNRPVPEIQRAGYSTSATQPRNENLETEDDPVEEAMKERMSTDVGVALRKKKPRKSRKVTLNIGEKRKASSSRGESAAEEQAPNVPVESSNNAQEAPLPGVTEVDTQADIEVEEARQVNIPEVPVQEDTDESVHDFILQKRDYWASDNEETEACVDKSKETVVASAEAGIDLEVAGVAEVRAANVETPNPKSPTTEALEAVMEDIAVGTSATANDPSPDADEALLAEKGASNDPLNFVPHPYDEFIIPSLNQVRLETYFSEANPDKDETPPKRLPIRKSVENSDDDFEQLPPPEFRKKGKKVSTRAGNADSGGFDPKRIRANIWVGKVKKIYDTLLNISHPMLESMEPITWILGHYMFCSNEDMQWDVVAKSGKYKLYRWLAAEFRQDFWLNEESVDIQIDYLNKQTLIEKRDTGVRSSIYLTMDFSRKIELLNPTKGVEYIKKTFKRFFQGSQGEITKVNQYIFIPHGIENHWAFHVIDLPARIIYVVDGLRTKKNMLNNFDFAQKLLWVLSIMFPDFGGQEIKFDQFEYIVEKCTEQLSGYECGFMMLRNLTKWYPDAPLKWDYEQRALYRMKLLQDLILSEHNEVLSTVKSELEILSTRSKFARLK